MTQRSRVVCLQRRLTHYREPVFAGIRDRLAERGVQFELVHGRPDLLAADRNDSGSLSWARVVEQSTIQFGSLKCVWVPTPDDLRDADLVIVTQENKLLANYAWLARRAFGRVKVAYWGHGANFQSGTSYGMREKWKRLMLTKVDWWFAYTDLTRDIVLACGYPAERITVLDNAIDNEAFQIDLDSISDAEANAIRGTVSHVDTPRIGLFCGSLYSDKRIDFMIRAADRVHALIPEFSLVVIGDGPSAEEVRLAAATRSWLHWVGARKGREKAAYFRVADVVFNPGAVGLHVLDSFCAGVPMATTSDARHGPEIAYLEHERNGVITDGDDSRYANAIIRLLTDQRYRGRLRAGARSSAERYTLKNMVERFADGIECCLARGKKR